ncbi:MAG: dihydrolipoamide succinyltransferase, partial [Gammaproteobacteria bacterium PRO9]|nr:dihydrolipoamide succinyltransferase [Gammaproteobacteria bacterium PRO9]
MSIEVKVPRLPESVADATLVAWHKAPGDIVERDENLADLETDKVVLEVPSPIHGVLKEIRIQGGATVTSGQVLAVLEDAGAEATAPPATAPATPPATPPASAAKPAATVDTGRSAGKTGPAARRALQEKGLDPATVQGTGPEGRILKSDVLKAAGTSAPVPAPATTPAQAPAAPRTAAPARPAASPPVARV